MARWSWGTPAMTTPKSRQARGKGRHGNDGGRRGDFSARRADIGGQEAFELRQQTNTRGGKVEVVIFARNSDEAHILSSFAQCSVHQFALFDRHGRVTLPVHEKN